MLAFSLPAMAQDTPMRVTPDGLTWKENPAFPKGVQIATLVGVRRCGCLADQVPR
jgi:hypothetical protein